MGPLGIVRRRWRWDDWGLSDKFRFVLSQVSKSRPGAPGTRRRRWRWDDWGPSDKFGFVLSQVSKSGKNILD
jgi:hypothetical protein